ncbi:hypothetical protein Vadar_020405 [Vaccinium darrowii]|uniref:Uncharacterized protein n=2 Tax=Vaccinium darrowii TaxID=229202 RepID=A0ACB7XF64_9ERIC|nr:hypothetical protein Vadar_002084 [Vaccinium darrowii]KAH7840697.1 hypothetical protein Vadar_020405 [Vaccinium darrowii]
MRSEPSVMRRAWFGIISFFLVLFMIHNLINPAEQAQRPKVITPFPSPKIMDLPQVKLLWNVLDTLKTDHDNGVTHGNLLNGINVLPDLRVQFVNQADPRPFEVEAITRDLLDFKRLILDAGVEYTRRYGPPPPPAAVQFHKLFSILRGYTTSVDGLKKFEFFLRNSPLFLDYTGKFLLAQKFIFLYQKKGLSNLVTCMNLSDLINWKDSLDDPALKAVRDFTGDGTTPKNEKTYKTLVGSIYFVRNCLGHLVENNQLENAAIMVLLEINLPHLLPVWYYAVVSYFDHLNSIPFAHDIGCDLMEFLKRPCSVLN